MDRAGRTRVVALGVLALVTALMAWDHLIGNEGGADEFPVDPAAFVIAVAACLATAVVAFGVVLRRATTEPGTLRAALWLTGLAVVCAPFLSWLGIPQVLAGGGLEGGLRLVDLGRRRPGIAVVVVCCLVLLLGILGTAVPAGDGD
jgi:hypothetical protein